MQKRRDRGLGFVLRHYREGALDSGKALGKVRARLADRNGIQAPLWRTALGVAASLLLVVGIFGWVRHNSFTSLESGLEKRVLLLPDNSVVTLAPESEISFRMKDLRGDGKRSVRLRGKAFFEVVHDESRPFEVHSEGLYVRVLGTRFEVNTLEHTGYVEEGKVLMAASSRSEGMLLTRGMGARLENGRPVELREDELGLNPVAWQKEYVSYEAAPLDKVLLELEELFGKDIAVYPEDTDPASLLLSGDFDTESPSDVLAAISEAFGIRLRFVSQSDGNMTLRMNGV